MWTTLFLSLQIATVAMAISVIAGTAIALVLAWKKLPLPDLVGALVSTPLVLPPTVLGYYLLAALGPQSFVGRAWHAVFGADIAFTFTGAVIAASVGSLPLVIGAVRVGIDAVEPELVAAARTLGASPARVLATVVLPLAAPGIVAGAMLGFARALGDYGMTLMLASARFDGLFGVRSASPASIFVYDELLASREDAARNMALATTALGVTMLFLAGRLTRRLHRG
jgi:molybdate transport system permease protein